MITTRNFTIHGTEVKAKRPLSTLTSESTREYSSKVLRIRATNNLEADPKSYTQMEYKATENYMLYVHSGRSLYRDGKSWDRTTNVHYKTKHEGKGVCPLTLPICVIMFITISKSLS